SLRGDHPGNPAPRRGARRRPAEGALPPAAPGRGRSDLRPVLPQPCCAPHFSLNRSISFWASASLISTSSAPTSPYSHSTIAELGIHLRSRCSASSILPSGLVLRRTRPEGFCTVRPEPTTA